MYRKEILAVLGIAAATMAFTLILTVPAYVGAEDEPPAVEPTIAQPTFTVDGCQFTLTTDKTAYSADEMPTLKITATNPTDEPVDVSVYATMTATTPASLVSRVMILPTALWQEGWSIRLEPGSTKTVELATETKLPAGSLVSISLGDKNQAVLLNQLSIQQAVSANQLQQ